jgi:hypothetical protein
VYELAGQRWVGRGIESENSGKVVGEGGCML